jgi:hypothetical protein
MMELTMVESHSVGFGHILINAPRSAKRFEFEENDVLRAPPQKKKCNNG